MNEPTKQLTFRLPEPLIARVEQCVSHLQEQSGMNLTRADIVRLLLTRALEDIGCDAQRLLSPRSSTRRRKRG